MQRSRVDLPEPDEPISATTSPSQAVSEMPFSTSSGPNDLWMSVELDDRRARCGGLAVTAGALSIVMKHQQRAHCGGWQGEFAAEP